MADDSARVTSQGGSSLAARRLWIRFWVAMLSTSGRRKDDLAASRLAKICECSIGIHLSYSAYPASRSRELTPSSSPFEYSSENSGCAWPVVGCPWPVVMIVLGAAVSCAVGLMSVSPSAGAVQVPLACCPRIGRGPHPAGLVPSADIRKGCDQIVLGDRNPAVSLP